MDCIARGCLYICIENSVTDFLKPWTAVTSGEWRPGVGAGRGQETFHCTRIGMNLFKRVYALFSCDKNNLRAGESLNKMSLWEWDYIIRVLEYAKKHRRMYPQLILTFHHQMCAFLISLWVSLLPFATLPPKEKRHVSILFPSNSACLPCYSQLFLDTQTCTVSDVCTL